MLYKLSFLIIFTFLFFFVKAQNNLTENLIKEGINYHKKGEYKLAIQTFDKVIATNPKSIPALGEKAHSLMMLNKYEEVVITCQKCIELNPNSKELKTVYTTYANSYDMMGQPKKALKIYDEGIKLFPNYFHLYFNKGITLSQMEQKDKAIANFEKSIVLQPNHSGSHNALARMHYSKKNKVQSLMAFSRFMILEPKGRRAELNLPFIQDITKGNAQETGPNSVTLSLDITSLPEENDKKKENDFTATALILSLNSGMNFTNKNKKKSEVQLFEGNIVAVCESLEELSEENFGFYWNYYAPYFIEMKQMGYIETFSYISYASTQEKYITKWLAKNKEKVDAFYGWSNGYLWKN
jgi:tetratricopeptide (TPR) repeat protein